MAEVNKRYIDIDADTRVGFNYIKQQFYVTNKEYTTYRNTIENIRDVLTALNIPTDDPTDEEILSLKTYMEDLYKVTFTLQDSGAYIHTLQFNDFKEYPLTLDCEKHKLYIMNSTIIYDLTLNESPRNVRIPRILSFYKNTLGLSISTEDMRYFYSLLVSNYYPTCYNQIETNTDTGKYYYNNKFLLSNYSNTSNATYLCTYNPNNNAENTQVGNVISTDTNSNTITLNSPVSESILRNYSNKIIIEGATSYNSTTETTYSADGTYTISSVDNNIITVEETIPYAYSFPYKECYVLAAQYTVESMNRTDGTITLSEAPENVLAGDIIVISGADVVTTYETISCNGTYTVESISDNVITVIEEIPTDFTGSAILIKEIFISNISKTHNKQVTLTDSTELDLDGATILIHTVADEETTIENFTVNNNNNNIINTEENVGNYDFLDTCPKLYVPIPDPNKDVEVLIDVTSVSENAEEIFPMGEFLVDSFEECQNYLSTLSGLTTPNSGIKTNIYESLPESIKLSTIPDITTNIEGDTISCSIENMEFMGLYSQVYTEL